MDWAFRCLRMRIEDFFLRRSILKTLNERVEIGLNMVIFLLSLSKCYHFTSEIQ